MMNFKPAAFGPFLLSVLAVPAFAQQPPVTVGEGREAPLNGGDDPEEILVVAGTPRGAVIGNIEPELQLNAADIRAYGAGSIQELLQELSPQTGSGRGRASGMPVILINGKRISGFAEIRNIPPEAIERLEILPEETALSYGYRADQRVVNFILRQRFRAVTAEVEMGGSLAGGARDYELKANRFGINGESRILIDLQANHSTRLLESQRDIVETFSAWPYSLAGNITAPTPGDEIDPQLSALAGQSVTIAGVPGLAALSAPKLADFVTGSNNPNTTDTGRYRTLRPVTSEFSTGISITRPLSSKVQATFSARLETDSSESWLGLPATNTLIPAGNPYSPFVEDVSLLRYSAAPGPLVRDSKGWNGRIAAAFNGEFSPIWRWTLTASHDHSATRTLTDRSLDTSDVQDRILALDPALNPFGDNMINGRLLTDRATSNTDISTIDAVLNGNIAEIAAGKVASTFKFGAVRRDLAGETRRNNLVSLRNLDRNEGRASANLDIPLTSIRNDVLPFMGDLSLNLNAEAEQFSDFGSLFTWGGGFTWRPADRLQFIASFTSEEGAPSIQQLGDPATITPNVRVFDYVRGETVEINRIDGGNVDLSADRRRVIKLGGRWRPMEETDLSIQADYLDSRITGPISGFPSATAEIEAAFPQRFLRDADGRLLQIDNRPINFEESKRREIRWGINFSEKLEPTKAEQAAMEKRRAEFMARRQQAAASGAPPAGVGAPAPSPSGGAPASGGGFSGPPGGPGGFGGPPGGPGRGARMGEGRFQLSVFHTFRLEDTITIRDGVPKLDLLNGSATGSNGGVSRHQVEVRTGLNKNGMGARLSLNWQSGTKVLVDRSGVASPDDLRFSDLATVDLRLFADLGQRPDLARKYPWLRGARVSLLVDNLFDSKLSVRDRAGVTPINYQPDLIDPVGRRVEISFRKVFF